METVVAGVCPAVVAPIGFVLLTMPGFVSPGRLSPAFGTVIVIESVAVFVTDVGSLGVNGFGLDALLAAFLTVWSIESGIAKPPLGIVAPAAEAGGCPMLAESGEKVDGADDGAAVGSE